MTRILIHTVGTTPQVVTETVHALASRNPPWLPARIVLATTAEGAAVFNGEKALPALLGQSGRLARLYAFLGLSQFHVEPEVLVAKLSAGAGEEKERAISDIRTEAEIAAFGQLLLDVIGPLTADPLTEIHLSLAGGRKSMSAIALQVMSLFARAQDELTHVLVEPQEIENLASFWWPGQPEQAVDRTGIPKDTANAKVELNPVAFVRLRAWLDTNEVFRKLPTSYADAVSRADAALGAKGLVLDLVTKRLTVGGLEVRFGQRAERDIALLALILLSRKKGELLRVRSRNHNEFVDPTSDKEDSKIFTLGNDPARAYRELAWLRAASAMDEIYEGIPPVTWGAFDAKAAKFALDTNSMEAGQRMSRLRRQLREELGRNLADRIVRPNPLTFESTFQPEDITILIPAEVADHPDRPHGLSLSNH